MKLVEVEQPKTGEYRVQCRGVVPLRRKEEVALVAARVEPLQFREKQPGHDVDRAQAGARMPGPGTGDAVENVDPRIGGKHGGVWLWLERRALQLPKRFGRHVEQLVRLHVFELRLTHLDSSSLTMRRHRAVETPAAAASHPARRSPLPSASPTRR